LGYYKNIVEIYISLTVQTEEIKHRGRELTCFQEHMVRKIPVEWYVYEYFDDSDVVPLLKHG